MNKLNISVTPMSEMPDFTARWTALYGRSKGAGFFLSPAWIGCWVAQVQARFAPHVVQVTGVDGPQLMGLVCLGKKTKIGSGLKQWGRAVLGARPLFLHETGNARMDSLYIEYNDFLVAADAPAEIRDLAWRAVLEHFSVAETIVVQNAVPAMRDSLQRMANGKKSACRIVHENPVYVTDLAALRVKGSDVLGSLSKNTRKQIERSARLYQEQAGVLKVKLVGGPDQPEEHRLEAWQNLQDLHGAVWQARGEKGVFANPDLVAFHEYLQREAPQNTQLVTLYAGSTLVGSLYNFVHEQEVMNYQSGFVYEQDNRLKPGLLTHVLAAQHYLDAGYACYNMLAGETRYKKSLGTLAQTLSQIELERPGLKTTLRQTVRHMAKHLE